MSKAILVLDTIAPVADAITLSEVGRRSGLSKATVHRILAVLEAHGMVQRCPGGFRLGDRPRAWAEQSATPQAVGLRTEAMPFLVDLHRGARLATALLVLSGDTVEPVYRLHDRRQAREIAPVVDRTPAHCTAAGKVLLAFDPDAAERLLARPALTAYTAKTITSPERLRRALEHIRAEGLGHCDGEFHPAVTALAVPIIDRSRRAIAAVAVGGPRERVQSAGIQRLLRSAAANISFALKAAQQCSGEWNAPSTATA